MACLEHIGIWKQKVSNLLENSVENSLRSTTEVNQEQVSVPGIMIHSDGKD